MISVKQNFRNSYPFYSIHPLACRGDLLEVGGGMPPVWPHGEDDGAQQGYAGEKL